MGCCYCLVVPALLHIKPFYSHSMVFDLPAGAAVTLAARSFFTCNDFSIRTGLVTGFLLYLISPLLTVQFRYNSRGIVNLH